MCQTPDQSARVDLHELAALRSGVHHRSARPVGSCPSAQTLGITESTAMSGSSVDANYRFIAAYQEVNARIVQRQQALALYVTLTVSLLAALVALGTSNKNSTVPVECWCSASPCLL